MTPCIYGLSGLYTPRIAKVGLSSKLMGFVKMKIVDRIDIDIVKEFIQNGIEKGSKIITDGLWIGSKITWHYNS